MWMGRLNSIIEKVFPTLQYTDSPLKQPVQKTSDITLEILPWILTHPARNSCFLANITCRNRTSIKRTPAIINLDLHVECSLCCVTNLESSGSKDWQQWICNKLLQIPEAKLSWSQYPTIFYVQKSRINCQLKDSMIRTLLQDTRNFI